MKKRILFVSLLGLTLIFSSIDQKRITTSAEEDSSKLALRDTVLHAANTIFVRALNRDTSAWVDPFIIPDTNSLHLLDLPNLRKLTGNTFYSLTMFNGHHFEYNAGKIPVILSYNQTNPARSLMLFPLGYCCGENSKMFMDQFMKQDITQKDATAQEISSLFLHTKTRNAFN